MPAANVVLLASKVTPPRAGNPQPTVALRRCAKLGNSKSKLLD
jgi:hypothetical protein